jgi:two-component system phosphate regulon sensor histidine kinase PhoR
MNDNRYRWILYTIVAVIIGTIAIQIYWNYKNYLVNKQQLTNDVQHSLDKAVESYYANLAENNTIAFAYDIDDTNFMEQRKLDSLIHTIEISGNSTKSLDSVDIELIDGLSVFRGIETDSFLKSLRKSHIQFPKTPSKSILKRFSIDSTSQFNFRRLTSKVVLSMTSDTLQLKDIDSLFREELTHKKLDINYGFTHENLEGKTIYLNPDIVKSATLKTKTKSPFLDHTGTLTVHFSNETRIILGRILSGILISTLLILAVISCLFYLLKIIKHQKQLAEVKNDLISNITHEFKTPIATISVAIESIRDFDIINDKDKTKKYLDMSGDQLSKLNLMVEKLLETATLDSDNLELNKEEINVTELLKSIVNKHQFELVDKTLTYISSDEDVLLNVDLFHIENAINNVIDNAIKYGGNEISADIKQTAGWVEISILDNGSSLIKANKDKLFEKFYRISKGNTHDVKGFGIGLYYSKKIIEKHHGTIALDLSTNTTCFKISLPNE